MRRSRPLLGRVVAGIGGGAAMLVLSATPASAHSNSIVQGSDRAVINASHTSGYVCDNEPDGRYTYVAIRLVEIVAPVSIGAAKRAQGDYWLLYTDTDGAGGKCSTFQFDYLYEPLEWKLCEGVDSGTDPCTALERI